MLGNLFCCTLYLSNFAKIFINFIYRFMFFYYILVH